MSEIHRYQVVKMLSEGGNAITYNPHGPEVVMAKAHDKRVAELEAELAEADDLILFLAKVYCEMDRIRYETMSVPEGEIVDFMISNWPVVQGTANQIRLMRLGEMPYDSGKLAAAIDACLARHGDKS